MEIMIIIKKIDITNEEDIKDIFNNLTKLSLSTIVYPSPISLRLLIPICE